MKENKSYGFEIHDARLGGLMMRVLHCADTLEAYADGSIEDRQGPAGARQTKGKR